MAEPAVKKKKEKPPIVESLLAPGHRACAGCGEALGAKLVMDAAGPNTYATCCTGCLEVFSTPYPESAWKMPWIHSLFENSNKSGLKFKSQLHFKEVRMFSWN